MSKLTRRELAHFREKLQKILGQSAGTRDQIETESLDVSGRGLDTQGDEGSDRQFEEVDLSALGVEGTNAKACAAALRRISEGTYGRCEACDAWIPRGRLEAIPYAALCLGCQERLDEEAE